MELLTMGISALWGIALATAVQLTWQANRTRRTKQTKWCRSLISASLDLFVPVAAGTAVFYTLYKVNSGQVRAYVLLGLGVGWAVHKLLLERPVQFVSMWAQWGLSRARRAASRWTRRTSRRVRASLQGFPNLRRTSPSNHTPNGGG